MIDCTIDQSRLSGVLYNFVWIDPGWFFSPAGSSDLCLNLSCMTTNLFYLCFSTLRSSPFRRTDTTIFGKLNKPLPLPRPVSIKLTPPNVFEINKPPAPLPRLGREDLRMISKPKRTQHLAQLLELWLYCRSVQS